MKKNNQDASKGLLYNNKFLVVFSVVLAVIFWATVKVNYSENITTTFSEVALSFDNILKDTEFTPYMSSDTSITVSVSGKPYNVRNTALTKDQIIVEPVNTFIDSTGYKYVTLSARFVDPTAFSGVEITKVTPSSVKVYFDRETTATFNVVAKLSNNLKNVVKGEYVVGQPVPSVTLLDITGPATVLNEITEVYFEGSIDESELPLTQSKEVPATVSFGLDNSEFESYLSYEAFDEQKNPAKINVPVYVTKDVPTQVKFVGQPSVYTDNPPMYKVTPSKVTVSYNPQDIKEIESFVVGTIDFRTLDNKLNTFNYSVDETMAATLTDKTITDFTVTVNMSDKKSISPEAVPTKIVLSGKVDGYNYSTIINEESFLEKIRIIGPAASLDKITTDDIQIEINVADFDVENENSRTVEITNISVQKDDCWIYGSCNAVITAEKE